MEININIVFKGKTLDIFSCVNKFNIEFHTIHRPGSTHTLPSGMERKVEYGYLELSYNIEKEEDSMLFLLNKLKQIKIERQNLLSAGLEESILYITIPYEDQFNWEFTPEILFLMGELEMTLAISTYEI